MKKVVLFDLDGTLLDTSEGIKNAVSFVAQDLGLANLKEAELAAFIGPPIYESFRKKYSLNEEMVHKATELFRDVYSTRFLFQAEVYEGIPELLQYLKAKGYLLGVATNKRYDYVAPLLEKFGLLSFFDDVQGTDFQNTLKKPDVIRNCLNNLGIDEDDATYMIGDTLQDYNGAMTVGLEFIGVKYGFGTFDEAMEGRTLKLVDTANDLMNLF